MGARTVSPADVDIFAFPMSGEGAMVAGRVSDDDTDKWIQKKTTKK